MISACLIVKNEETFIAECIENLKTFCSQIVIADTGSTDGTLKILKSSGVEYFEIPWEEHFANARNLTLARAKEPWIFSFDADERVSLRSIEQFKKLIEEINSNSEFEAISLVRRNYCANPSLSGFKPCEGEFEEEKNYAGYYTERMTRIFRNRSHIRWTGKVHEMIEPSLQKMVFNSDLIFHHYGYTPEEETKRQKNRFYQAIGEKKIRENPNDWKAHYDLACEYLPAGKLDEAISEFEIANSLLPRQAMILSNMGYALMEKGDFVRCHQILQECLRAQPYYHDALLNYAVSFMRQKRWSEAIQTLDLLLQHHPKSFLGHRNQGLCYLHINQTVQAIHCFETALQLFPQFNDARLDLSAAYFLAKEREKSLLHLHEVLKIDPQNTRAKAWLTQIKSS